MSKSARDFLLSTLDNLPPDTVMIFICNSTDSFEPRFLSRTRILEFSNYGLQREATEMLARIWKAEAPGSTAPNMSRMVKDVNGNVRAALMALELELMLAL